MKLIIPEQLRAPEFRFIKILHKSKQPSETKWESAYNYKYTEDSFKKYLKEATGYGVLCGLGKLAVIDCDTKELAQQLFMELPQTFSITTGSGGIHLYYIIKDLDKKIVINDNKKVHHGEVQFNGAYVVGPNSIHPNGKSYKIKNNLPIQKITKKELLKALKPFLKDKPEFVENASSGMGWDISVILEKLHGLTERERDEGNEWYGQHPVHGSRKDDDGDNFNLNPTKNVWHCYRCGTGGDALSLIAVLEKLIDCDQCTKGFFSTPEGIEVFHKAKIIGIEKYGYDANDYLTLFDNEKKRRGLHVKEIVENIKQRCQFITVRDATGRLPHIYVYQNGYYKLNGEDLLAILIKSIFSERNIPFRMSYKTELLDYMKTENVVERDEIQPPKHLLNFNNGVYDLKANKLLHHSPDYYFLYKIPWNYRPAAECPKIMKYFKSTLKPEFIKFTQEIFGYCLMFDYRHAAIFYLYGTGGNGKSVWTKILEHMLGPKNVANKSIDSLVKFRFTSSLLYGKLANICGELSSELLKNTDTLKSLSAGDSIQAEFKGKDGFDFQNKAKIITACNFIPHSTDMTYGWYDRQYIIPFLKKFRYSKQEDTELLDKLLIQCEMEGLLTWALVGLLRLLKNKHFSYPQDKKERYLMCQRNVKYFVEKCYKKTTDRQDVINVDEIYEHYCDWCEKNSVPKDSKNALGREFTYRDMPHERISLEKAIELKVKIDDTKEHIDIRRYIRKV